MSALLATTTLVNTSLPITQGVATPIPADPYAQQKADAARSIADAQQHRLMVNQQQQQLLALAKIHTLWQVLPIAPYPPAGDTSAFPRTGDQRLRLDPSSINKAQLAEPGKATANLLAQAKARTPHPNALFWIGLACLGAGLWIRNR